ncbi:ribonuclease III [Trichothermofontia sp.]
MTVLEPPLDPRRYKELRLLVQKLGLSPAQPIQWHLLDHALTHVSVSSTNNYEQLEFIGDAVVRLAATEFLVQAYPHLPEGELSAVRAILVSDRVLAQLADQYGFARSLLVSAGASGDQAGRESRLANAFEAVLAALYLSTHTLELIRPWLDLEFKPLAIAILNDPARQNYKAALQEWTQGTLKQLPEYRVTEISSLHGDQERFQAEVWLQGHCLGTGKGRSIKQAEQAAAKVAWQRYHPSTPCDPEIP